MSAKDAKEDLLQDSLLREIDEDLRRDRALKLWKKYRGLLGLVVVLLLAAVAGTQFYAHYRAERLSAAAAAFAEAEAQKAREPALAAAGFASLAEKGPRGYALLARFEAAALLARQGDRAGAIAAYEQAGRETEDGLYRDLATLLAVLTALEAPVGSDKGDVDGKLAGLAADGGPWRYSALELQALRALEAGQRGEAERLLQQLRDDAAAPAGIRDRAGMLLSQTGRN